jgi:hypothetical protein
MEVYTEVQQVQLGSAAPQADHSPAQKPPHFEAAIERPRAILGPRERDEGGCRDHDTRAGGTSIPCAAAIATIRPNAAPSGGAGRRNLSVATDPASAMKFSTPAGD